MNPDLVPIKGPREALESKLAPDATSANRFVDFNFEAPLLPPSLPFVGLSLSPSPLFHPSTTPTLRCPVLFLPLSRVPTISGDLDGNRARNRRLYERTPVIGWSRFIDAGISPFERALVNGMLGISRFSRMSLAHF